MRTRSCPAFRASSGVTSVCSAAMPSVWLNFSEAEEMPDRWPVADIAQGKRAGSRADGLDRIDETGQ
jgi:hypothetical protein